MRAARRGKNRLPAVAAKLNRVKVRFCGATPKRDRLELGFWFDQRDDNPRFTKVETLTMNAHVHRASIRGLEELDETVRRWIDRAYRVGCRKHLR